MLRILSTGSSGFRMLLVSCGPVLAPLPCQRFGCNPELWTHLIHTPVSAGWEDICASKMLQKTKEKGNFWHG